MTGTREAKDTLVELSLGIEATLHKMDITLDDGERAQVRGYAERYLAGKGRIKAGDVPEELVLIVLTADFLREAKANLDAEMSA